MLKDMPVENPYIDITLIEMWMLYKCHVENCTAAANLVLNPTETLEYVIFAT